MAGDAPSGTAYPADAPPRAQSRSLLWTIVPAVCGMPLIGLAVLVLLPPLRIGLDDARAPRSVVPSQQTAAYSPAPVPAPPRPETPVEQGGMQLSAPRGVPLAALGPEPTEADATPPDTRTYAFRQAPAEEVGPPESVDTLPAMGELAQGDIAAPPDSAERAPSPRPIPPGTEAAVPSTRDGDAVAAATATAPAGIDDDATSPGQDGDSFSLAAVSQPLPPAPAFPRAQPPASTVDRAPRSGAGAVVETSLDARCRAVLVRLQLEAAPQQADLGFLRRSCTPDRR